MATTNANESRAQKQYRFQPKEHNNKFNRNNNRYSFPGKDEEEGNRTLRSHNTAADNKPKHKNELEQSDKFEAMKRLERDKKAMQRKLREEETEKPKRPAMKQRRSSKSDWTKEYEYGLLDEELDYAK